jgi:hypothetical protein
MKEILQDIIKHTHNLGFLNTIKIVGEEKSTKLVSVSDDRTVIMSAEAAVPYTEMVGTFGMSQLNKLKFLVEGSEYQKESKIEVIKSERNGVEIPVGLHFENKDGDFKNDFRFMNAEIIKEKIKDFTFRSPKWDIEVNPTVQSIQRFQFQAGANTEHTTFLVKIENKNLKFVFGNVASHGGEFIFANDVKGKLTNEYSWPINVVLNILKISDVGTCTLSISNEGALQITLDSGLAVYKYFIPATA